MGSIYTNADISLSIDMDDLGVRPVDWIDLNKGMGDPMEELFGSEKLVDVTVYSAEFQLLNSGKRITTNESETTVSDDDDDDGNNEYDIDPETGEKIFREVAFAANIPLSSPSDERWIEEYLLNIESSSANPIPPSTTTNSPFTLENLPFLSPANFTHQTDADWFSNLFDLEESNDHTMVTDSVLSSEFLGDNESTSHRISTATNNQLTPHLSSDDECSASDSSDYSHQRQSFSSVGTNDDITFVEAKLEKIDHEDTPLSQMMVRRSSVRSISQGQQDEEVLRHHDIPLALEDITQSSTEEYNRHLARLRHLSAEQIHVIKDIRRRGKNKIAAQNCRKRKLVSVESLLDEVDELKRVKQELEERKRAYQQQIGETRHQYEYLHRQVLPDRQLPPAIIVT